MYSHTSSVRLALSSNTQRRSFRWTTATLRAVPRTGHGRRAGPTNGESHRFPARASRKRSERSSSQRRLRKDQVGASYDVAVVGFGPSGAVAAGLLGREGVRVLVCERSRTVYEKPRAIALDHEIMRVFQQLGVVERVEPWIAPFRPSEYYGVDGQ